MKKVYDIPKALMRGNESIRRVYDESEECPSLDTMGGGNREPKIAVSETICLNSKVDGKQPSLNDRVYDDGGVSVACTTTPFFMGNVRQENQMEQKKLTIRKLTEGECYRLMGFEEKDTEACKKAGQSAANIYHQAGDSIVTTVLMGIFGELLGIDYRPKIEAYADKLHKEVIGK